MHRIMVEPRPGVKYLFLIGVIALNYHTGAFEDVPLGDDNVVVAMFTEISERKRFEKRSVAGDLPMARRNVRLQ